VFLPLLGTCSEGKRDLYGRLLDQLGIDKEYSVLLHIYS